MLKTNSSALLATYAFPRNLSTKCFFTVSLRSQNQHEESLKYATVYNFTQKCNWTHQNNIQFQYHEMDGIVSSTKWKCLVEFCLWETINWLWLWETWNNFKCPVPFIMLSRNFRTKFHVISKQKFFFKKFIRNLFGSIFIIFMIKICFCSSKIVEIKFETSDLFPFKIVQCDDLKRWNMF